MPWTPQAHSWLGVLLLAAATVAAPAFVTTVCTLISVVVVLRFYFHMYRAISSLPSSENEAKTSIT